MSENENDINYMPITEFVDLGFLQEINRRVLHPAGLALELAVSDGDWTTLRIWDYRGDEEGVLFAEGVIQQDKIDSVNQLIESHYDARVRLVGSNVQWPAVSDHLS